MSYAYNHEPTSKPPVSGGLLPTIVRQFVQRRDSGMVAAAVVIGLASGVLVAAMSWASQLAHVALFDIALESHLSASSAIPWQRLLVVPVVGGLVLALIARVVGNRLKGPDMADAIEANALYGGRVSMRGSLLITLQTLVSNGFGGSVGLEAAYTQICSAFSSFFGRKLAVRRSDMRLLVACGASGAISAAFSAPLAGTFYAYETILGAYTTANLVPVIASAVASWLVSRTLTNHTLLMISGFPSPVSVEMIGQCVLLGVICAFASIVLMLGVAVSERAFRKLKMFGGALRPVIGGAVLGAMALLTPAVLGAGHGAMQLVLVSGSTWQLLAATIVLKMMASAISLGSGFRGGLFFASLLLGVLIGLLYSAVAGVVIPSLALQPGTAAIAALAAVGTGVIGAPFSMICLALETTGEFSLTVGAIVASSVAALIVRELFGYSFATWRFHLRGEAIRGPQDVGWIRQFSAATLMRSDCEAISGTTSVAEAVRIGTSLGVRQLVLQDANDRYAGVVDLADLHAAAGLDDESLYSFAQQIDDFLCPHMTIREILTLFKKTDASILAVVDNPTDRNVVGLVSEAHVLRIYGEELEHRNQEMFFRYGRETG